MQQQRGRPFVEAFRTKPCKFFFAPVGCRNGDTCRFIHHLPQETPIKTTKMPVVGGGGGAPPASPVLPCCSGCARTYVREVHKDPRDEKWYRHFRRVHVQDNDDGILNEDDVKHFWRIFNQLLPRVYTSLTWSSEMEHVIFRRLKGIEL